MQRVKLTAENFYYDKYHGYVPTGVEVAILQRSQPWNPLSKWIAESSSFVCPDAGEAWDTKWCPVHPGKTYTGPNGRRVTVEILED